MEKEQKESKNSGKHNDSAAVHAHDHVHSDHHHHGHDVHPHSHAHDHLDAGLTPFQTAVSATLHCLFGCGLGEVLGVALGRFLLLGNTATLILGIILGFVLGLVLGVWPLLKSDMPLGQALKIIVASEGLSIVVMETAEVLVQIYTPGVMAAGLGDKFFWLGMMLSLAAGFFAALPVNYFLIMKGVAHKH